MTGPSMDVDRAVETAADLIRRQAGEPSPSIALILGSGLGDYWRELHAPKTFSTADLPGYPRSTVEGHAGRIHIGRVGGPQRSSPTLLVFQGRVHPYESGDANLSRIPVRLAAALGCDRLVITNAAGGIRPSLGPGDLMLHSGLLAVPNRLGRPTAIGAQSIRMTAYDPELQQAARASALNAGFVLQEGVYCWVTGPSYETPAEVEMLRRCGADAVGMSTWPEVDEAARSSLRTVAFSLITNKAAGLGEAALDHADVTRTASQAADRITALLTRLLTSI